MSMSFKIHCVNQAPAVTSADDGSIYFIREDNSIQVCKDGNLINFGNSDSTDSLVAVRVVTSDSDGLVNVPVIDGYTYVNAVSFDWGKPLNVIRFGDDIYVGYYGGSSIPNTDSAITLLFTSKANQEVTCFYIKNSSTLSI